MKKLVFLGLNDRGLKILMDYFPQNYFVSLKLDVKVDTVDVELKGDTIKLRHDNLSTMVGINNKKCCIPNSTFNIIAIM